MIAIPGMLAEATRQAGINIPDNDLDIAKLTLDEVKKITYDELLEKGFQVGYSKL